jgi:N-acetylneuraminate lyase
MTSSAVTHHRGIWPAMITPFTTDDSVDLATLEKLIAKLIAQGADGLYLCGSTGEGPLMTPDERRTVLERSVKVVAGQIPIIAHVGGGRPADDIELARHAGGLKIAGVSSVPPIYYPYPPESVFAHFSRIAEAAGVPFYGYHLTGQSSRPLSMAQYVEGLMQIPNAAGIKYTGHSSADIAMLKRLSGGKLTVFSGSDECFLANMAQGADAAIGSFYNIFLPEWKKIEQLGKSGRWDDARDRMATASHAIMSIIRFGLDITKHLLAKQGLDCGHVRHPWPRVPRPCPEFEAIWTTLTEFRANVGM